MHQLVPAALVCYSLHRPPPTSTLFPYTTLFRSHPLAGAGEIGGGDEAVVAGPDDDDVVRPGHDDPFAGPRALQYVDRKSTRLNSSHLGISYAVFCLKKKKKKIRTRKEYRHINTE